MAKKRLMLPLYDELLSLDHDLFNEERDWETPDYIANNMVHKFRYYQNTALRFFHYSQVGASFQHRNINHVLFNMATGSGKTDLMAGLILYLYQDHGYQNFLFLVNTNGVLTKTVDNLINTSSDKYLYTSPIEIEGKRVHIKQVNMFPKTPDKNTIYLKLSTVQSVANDIYVRRENTMGEKEYAQDKVVILGDEAHHYSASTKSEKENEQSWENAINTILRARSDNKLIEFTATIDLENKKIHEKYKDKIIYRYALDRFIQDRYSKNVRRIQSSNTDIENMLNVVLLSEYRRRYALECHGSYIKPVIMFKSQRIQASKESHKKFNDMIENLTPSSLLDFINRQLHMRVKEESETLCMAYQYYLNQKDSLPEIVRDIKREMNPNRIINANDTSQSGILEKGQYEALNSLESPSNLYRVIFAVARLTEGWDVLNLYDIVRLSDDPKVRGTRTTTMSEAQLIGRGARYNPFKLKGEIAFKRRFNDGSKDSLILETLHYHTINEPQYLKNLVNSLDEMNLPTGQDKKNPLIDVKVKPSFKQTNVWKKGKIYYNETIEMGDEYYDSLEKYGVDTKKDIVIPYLSTLREVNYRDKYIEVDYTKTSNVAITFDGRYLNKVMDRNYFFHLNNLKKYIPLLKSRQEFLGENWLNMYNRTVYVTLPSTMEDGDLSAKEKLRILEMYFKKLENKIKKGYKKRRGTKKFIGYPIKDYISDYRKRVPNYDTGNKFGVRVPQIIDPHEVKDDFYVYDVAIVNLTERNLIERIAERIPELKENYEDVYLIRMDENMHRESAKRDNLKLHQFGSEHPEINVSGFQPDFILYLQNQNYIIQIFIEPKGHNIEEEQWKEDLLLHINNHEAEIIIDEEINDVKVKGVRFFTIHDSRDTIRQIGEIALEEGFKGLSYSE